METATMSEGVRAAAQRSRVSDWAYEVLPPEVRALRDGTGWLWCVTQEAVIDGGIGASCRGRTKLEVDGPSGRLTSVRHSFETPTGTQLDVTALGVHDLDAALLALMHRTARAVHEAHVTPETQAAQVYKLAGVLAHLCREAMRRMR